MPDVAFECVRSQEQIAEAARLAKEIWTEHYVRIIGQAQVEYMLAKFQSREAIADQIAGESEYYLIVQADQKVGYFAIVPEPASKNMLLSKIYVRHDRRGSGLGQAALAFIGDLCRQRGIRTLWLTVNRHNERSIRWYERMGFVNAGPIVQDIGGGFVMDDFRMEKAADTNRGFRL